MTDYTINQRIVDKKRDLTIIDIQMKVRSINEKKKRKVKHLKYHCNKCGNEDWVQEYIFKSQNIGCNVCCSCPKKVKEGINDIATTNPESVKYFKNPEDAKKYSKKSEKLVDTKCPICGFVRKQKPKDITKKFVCLKCSDGISAPNKLMYAILIESNLEFISEYSPDWLNMKRYDFYIPSMNLIIEMDGAFHYEQQYEKLNINKVKETDTFKEKLANENGLTVIRIDCGSSKEKSEDLWQSVLNSDLTKYIDLNEIDKNKCLEFTYGSLISSVCIEYNNKIKLIDIADKYKISINTIIKYLKIGNDIGLCKYTPKNAGLKIAVYDLNKNYICTFKSSNQLCKSAQSTLNIKIGDNKLRQVCTGQLDSYKGYIFKYVLEE